jgi:hypothetical protein
MVMLPILAAAFVAQSYAVVTPAISIQPGTGEAYHRVPDRLNGTTWALAGGAGVFLKPSVALEGEVVFAGDVSAPQEFHYTASTEYTASNRDILINELVRYRAGGTAAVQLVVGGGYQHTTTQQTDQTYVDNFGRRSAVPDSVPQSYSGFTWTAGMDAVFRAGAHAAIGPTFRVRWMHRPIADGVGWNGIGPFAFQVGATVQFHAR